MDDTKPDHWPLLGRRWHLLGPPLRPSPGDVRVVEGVCAAWQAMHPGASLRALLLGVTPELATQRWPAGTALQALDHSQGMIEAVWPRAGLPAGASVRCAEWLEPPFDDGAMDLVAGDGVLTVLGSAREHRALCRQVRRLLVEDGRFVIRLFVAPDPPETLASLEEDLWAGRVGTFHALKWRFLMAVQDPVRHCVPLADAWTEFQSFCPDPAALTTRLGWAPETVATIHAYRDATASFTFPTLAEARATLSEGFDELECHVPSYELGARCPTLVLRRGARPT